MKQYIQTLLIVIFLLSSTRNIYAQNNIIRNSIYLEKENQPVHYILILPKNYESSRKYPLFIFMHGLGYSPDDVLNDEYPLLTNQDSYILLPQGSIRHHNGFSWYDRNSEKFIVHLEESESMVISATQYIMKNYNIDSSRIVLSGFSQGGRLSFYIGFKNPKLFSEIAPIGGVYMEDILDAYIDNIGDMKVSIYHGTQDDRSPFENIEKAYKELKAKGVNVSLHSYPLNHTYTMEMLETILNNI